MLFPSRAVLRAAVCLSILALSAPAQTAFDFAVKQSTSNFTWSGTTSVGPIVGNPSTAFQMAGTTGLTLTTQAGVQPIATAAFTGGDAFTVPDLHGKVVNIITLATIDVTGLHLVQNSAPMALSGAGAFSGTGNVTALAGTLTVTPFGGSPTNTPLTGSVSNPGPIGGTITLTGGTLHLNQPISTSFSFTDVGSGVTGTIILSGTLNADYVLATSYCFGDGSAGTCPCGNASVGTARGCNNSSGTGGAQLAAVGVASLANDSVAFTSSFEQPTAPTIFLQGSTTGAGVTFGQGLRCAGGTLKRLFLHFAVAGVVAAPSGGDLSTSAQSTALGDTIVAGQTRYYQAYYRDTTVLGGCPSTSTYNASQALSIAWHP